MPNDPPTKTGDYDVPVKTGDYDVPVKTGDYDGPPIGKTDKEVPTRGKTGDYDAPPPPPPTLPGDY